MAQVLIAGKPISGSYQIETRHRRPACGRRLELSAPSCSTEEWNSLRQSLKCSGRFSCLFSDNRKQEEARKALESALGGKKIEYEKWDKEMKRREEAGGGNSGGGGWFGWRRWFGDGDHFWQEAQQASLAILGILVVYLIVAKGDVMLAVISNPLLFALRGTRDTFSFVTSKFVNRIHPRRYGNVDTQQDQVPPPVSAKERVLGKWGSN
ncbi:uncharacterized protein LOC127254291 [Andrographis paniculata]|uniref:uncharacterized protein LOC127254291 n=1 Tax=Andrographis paniculata TaxID=175694 RepID=UPI0021E977E1|nr:uncharacterized protein LOC127254291 [Andrographis paniculata]XP_051135280.1 uncharacterized protein LOC127254291 [Andrographis paniculata]XP_051135281.1 uncharacterized protein LOC127254291 [Andrographis paniculata]XP_051135282.1 uncharacterized protein LOC127254291 [Andrographis paniculata]